MTLDAPPPQTLEAEKAVLGSMLIEPDACSWALAHLTADVFYEPRNGLVFRAVEAVYQRDRAADLTLVLEELRKNKTVGEVGGSAYLSDLLASVSTAAYVEHYGKLVLRAHFDRLIEKRATRLQYEDERDGVIDEIARICRARDLLEAKGLITMGETVDRVLAAMKQGPAEKVMTGFPELDRVIGGAEPGHLVTVGARTGVGKTAFCLTLMVNMARAGKNVAFFAGEMEPEQITLRALSADSKIEHWRLRDRRVSHAEGQALERQADMMRNLPISYCRIPSPRLQDIRATADAARAEVVIVDYLTRCSLPAGENMRVRVSQFMIGLKNFARETGRVVILAAQINRRVDGNSETPPNLSDLKESATIEEESDVVLLLHIPTEQRHASGPVQLMVAAAKNRHGKTGSCELSFDRRFLEIRDTGSQQGVGAAPTGNQIEMGVESSGGNPPLSQNNPNGAIF